MKISEIAKSYAKAIFVVTKQKGIYLKALSELSQISKIFLEDPAVMGYFSNPMISADKKSAIIREAIVVGNISEEVANLLVLMGEKNRLSHISAVVAEFQNLIDLEEGISRGVIRSAQPLTIEAQTEIELKINKILNKKISLTYQQDEKLLGGVFVQVGGWTFDDSIDSHLKKLNEELNRRAN